MFIRVSVIKMAVICLFSRLPHPIGGTGIPLESPSQIRYGMWPNNGHWDIPLSWPIALSNKFHNALVSYPTMHYFVTVMCTCVNISVTNGALWDICPMGFVRWVYRHDDSSWILVNICSANGLEPVWHQAITRTTADLFRNKFQNSNIYHFQCTWKMLSAKWQPICTGFNIMKGCHGQVILFIFFKKLKV